MSALRQKSSWRADEYIDSIMKSLEPINQVRQQRILRELADGKTLAFSELVHRLPDPPAQIARDVLKLKEGQFLELEPGETTTKVRLTDSGKRALPPL